MLCKFCAHEFNDPAELCVALARHLRGCRAQMMTRTVNLNLHESYTVTVVRHFPVDEPAADNAPQQKGGGNG